MLAITNINPGEIYKAINNRSNKLIGYYLIINDYKYKFSMNLLDINDKKISEQYRPFLKIIYDISHISLERISIQIYKTRFEMILENEN